MKKIRAKDILKRLDSVEERAEFQLHRELARQFKGRSADEQSFFAVHGYRPENADDKLPPGMEFSVRGIKTIVTTQWADVDRKT